MFVKLQGDNPWAAAWAADQRHQTPAPPQTPPPTKSDHHLLEVASVDVCSKRAALDRLVVLERVDLTREFTVHLLDFIYLLLDRRLQLASLAELLQCSHVLEQRHLLFKRLLVDLYQLGDFGTSRVGAIEQLAQPRPLEDQIGSELVSPRALDDGFRILECQPVSALGTRERAVGYYLEGQWGLTPLHATGPPPHSTRRGHRQRRPELPDG